MDEDQVFELIREVLIEVGWTCEHTNDDGPGIIVGVDDAADQITRRLRVRPGVFMSSSPETQPVDPHDYEPDPERPPGAMHMDRPCRVCGESRRSCESRHK